METFFTIIIAMRVTIQFWLFNWHSYAFFVWSRLVKPVIVRPPVSLALRNPILNKIKGYINFTKP